MRKTSVMTSSLHRHRSVHMHTHTNTKWKIFFKNSKKHILHLYIYMKLERKKVGLDTCQNQEGRGDGKWLLFTKEEMIYYIHLFILCACICGHTCTTVLPVQFRFLPGMVTISGVRWWWMFVALWMDWQSVAHLKMVSVTSYEFCLNSENVNFLK